MENVVHEQQRDKGLHAKCKKDKQKYKTEVRQDVKLITYEGRVYIPPCLRDNVLNWYHHYLQHPGANRMYNTICQTLYWSSLQQQSQCRTWIGSVDDTPSDGMLQGKCASTFASYACPSRSAYFEAISCNEVRAETEIEKQQNATSEQTCFPISQTGC